MTKVSKPTANGATVTPTANPASVARCGIPAPSKNGRNNVKLKLADDVVARLAALEKPLPAQAQAILYELDQLGGSNVGVSHYGGLAPRGGGNPALTGLKRR